MNIPKHLLEVARTARLHCGDDVAAKRLMSRLGATTRAQFEAAYTAGDSVPVVIPVHNEEKDLPSALVALARSRKPVLPIVVDNRSTDQTAARAEEMGAVVLTQPTGRKMAATQMGLEYVVEGGGNRALFIDGDTLVLPSWSEQMTGRLDAIAGPAGAAVFGNSYPLFGESLPTDLIMSGLGARDGWRRERSGRLPVGRGHNYGLQFDDRGVMRDALMSLDPGMFAGPGHPIADDTAILAEVVRSGATVVGSADPGSFVLTTNDRVRSLADWWRMHNGATWAEVAAPSYLEQYGMGPNGVIPAQRAPQSVEQAADIR